MRRLRIKGTRLEMDGVVLFEDGKEVSPNIRRLGDIKEVLLNMKAATKSNSNHEIYYMYRQLGAGKSRAFADLGIRYDVTVIPRYDIGQEFNKTLGHYHSIAEKGLSYPELYEVLEGEAFYIFQKWMGMGKFEVMLINAKAGDKVLVPPNYGHITVNKGKKTLVMANLVSDYFKPDYQSIIDMRGGVVYALKDGRVVLNTNYKNVSMRYLDRPEKLPLVKPDVSLYDQFLDEPEKFNFLQKPHMLKIR